MKVCPYCAESIQEAAVVCPHCRKSVTPASVIGINLMKLGCGLTLLIPLVLFVLAFVVALVF